MSKRKGETDEEYRARHRERERQRRASPEGRASIQVLRQTPEFKAKRAAVERERRRTDEAKAYEREYRQRYVEKNREKKQEYQHAWYLKNKDRHQAMGREWRKANQEKGYGYQLAWRERDPQRSMLVRSRSSAKQRGIEFGLTREDLVWPTHCPVLGIELRYVRDRFSPHRDDYPTLDRWDNSKGYVPGNVFVISWRANRIKWHCSADELEAVARYARHGL